MVGAGSNHRSAAAAWLLNVNMAVNVNVTVNVAEVRS